MMLKKVNLNGSRITKEDHLGDGMEIMMVFLDDLDEDSAGDCESDDDEDEDNDKCCFHRDCLFFY